MTDGTGAFRVPGVPVGTGTGTGTGRVSVSRLPTTCSSTDSVSYAGLIGGQSTAANVTVPCSFSATGIVAWSAAGYLEGLTAAQLMSGFPKPTLISVDQSTLSSGLAFDAAGNLWMSAVNAGGTQQNAVVALTPSQLTNPDTVLTPATVITLPTAAGFAPVGIAIDRSGTLWVLGDDSGMLYGFTADQLTVSGAPTPAHAFLLRPYPAGLLMPSFSKSGDMWIVGQDPSTGSSFMLRLAAAQLSSPNGPLTPVDSIMHGQGLDPSIDPVRGLAFDTAGNLWITGDAGYIAMFASTSLPGSGGDGVDVAPTLRFPGPFATVGALSFDHAGNLWDVTSPPLDNPVTQVLRYPVAAIEPGGSGMPDVVDSLNASALLTPLLSVTGLVFAPGNGESALQRVQPRITRDSGHRH